MEPQDRLGPNLKRTSRQHISLMLSHLIPRGKIHTFIHFGINCSFAIRLIFVTGLDGQMPVNNHFATRLDRVRPVICFAFQLYSG